MSNIQAAFKILGEVQNAYIDRVSQWVIDNEEELRAQASGRHTYFEGEELARVSEELRQIAMILACFPQPQQQQETATFGLWIAHMHAGNYQQAIFMLSVLLNIEPPLAEQCVQYFTFNLQFDGSLFHLVASLREAVIGGHMQATIQILAHCFGLDATHAVPIATYLQSTKV